MSSTDLTNFRDQYLATVQARLLAANVTGATDTELLIQQALFKAYDAVNNIDIIGSGAVTLLASMTGTQLQTWIQDPSNRQAFESVIASSTAMAAVIASSTAMAAVAASSTAMAAVAASSTAMTSFLSNTVSRGAIWASSTALAAIQSAPDPVIDSLLTLPSVSMMNNNPSSLTSVFISGKSMMLKCKNNSGSDTNSIQTLAGGSGTGNDVFSTTTAWLRHVRAYQDVKHYAYSNNYVFQGYIVNMN